MKITPISGNGPLKFIRSLYYANRPATTYKPIREVGNVPQEPNFIIKWFMKLFK